MVSRCPSRAGVALAAVLLLWAAAPSMRAAEPVLGRVVAIDADAVTVRIGLAEASGEQLRVVMDVSTLSPKLKPGSLVRLWRDAASTEGQPLAGARLEPIERALSGADRTGVRARLMYGAERGLGGSGGGR